METLRVSCVAMHEEALAMEFIEILSDTILKNQSVLAKIKEFL